MSANKLTMPMMSTNLNASFATGEWFFGISRFPVDLDKTAPRGD
jgi:hypothetical protein